MTPTQSPARPWYQKAARSFRKRWIQVVVILFSGLLALGLTDLILAPKESPGKAKDPSKYKYLHCNICKLEMSYSKEMDSKQCPKCVAPKPVGYFTPTVNSIKTGSGDSSPWRWFYLAAAIETLSMLSGIVYLLYLPVPDPSTTFYVCQCPNCNQKMRFRQGSLGQIGVCPRCKRPTRFPNEYEAVLESDLIRRETAAAEAEYAEESEEHG